MLNLFFYLFCSPTQYLTGDDSTVNFSGRVVFKMYDRQKVKCDFAYM
jgi:hypothetical protein